MERIERERLHERGLAWRDDRRRLARAVAGCAGRASDLFSLCEEVFVVLRYLFRAEEPDPALLPKAGAAG